MLVFVPQGFVALVFADGKLLDVVEAGVGVVERFGELQVQFVDLQPQPVARVAEPDELPEEWDA
ncbi:MAG TPA: hypothetical protein VFC18_00815 [Burkholderiales bacterium]|nr:hypothetical protein [Burkholderiales bacterium]